MNKQIDLNEISSKLTYYSINNIMWTLFYSGCGIPYFFNEKEINQINQLSKDEDKFFIENLMPLRCVYKKAKANFSDVPQEIINPGQFAWNFDSFDKEITVQSQAYAILSMISLKDTLNNNSEVFDYVLKRQLKNFIDFSTAYLRNKDGLFIDIEDKTKYLNDEIKVKQIKKDPKLLDQILIHEVMLAYSNYLKSCNEQSDIYEHEAKNLFKFIFENYNLILDLTTRDLSLVTSSLYRCCRLTQDDLLLTSFNELIALNCAEIESRIKINGEVEKSYNNYLPASLITHFRAASSLLEGYMTTKIEKFKESATKILNFTFDLFNENTGVFIIEDEIKYTIRDIAEVIKCLYLYYNITKDDNTLSMLNKFFNKSIEESGIMLSTVDRYFELNNVRFDINERIPLTTEVKLAPVFAKHFRVSNNILTTFEASKGVNNKNSLYASFIFLNMFSNTIDRQDSQNSIQVV